jgi:hypothetical protein
MEGTVATKETVEKILRMLDDRSGFDAWWDDIDEGTQDEIKDQIALIISESALSPQTFHCVLCIYTNPLDMNSKRDDTLIVVGGMLVCLDHAPFVPGGQDVSRAITAINKNDEALESLAAQALRKMK